MPVQRLAHEVALHRCVVERVPEDDRHVDRAAAHRRLGLRRLQLDEADVQPRRPRVQGHQHRRQQHRGGGREGGDPHEARREPGQGRQLLVGDGQPLDDGVGVAQQHPARLRQGDPATGANDERDAGVGLQPADVLAHGRLRPAQGAGRPGERARPADLPEDQQPAWVHATPKHRLGRAVDLAVLCGGRAAASLAA